MKKTKNLKKIILFFLFAVISGFVFYTAAKESYRSSKIEREIEELKREAEKAKTENLELKEKITYLQTDEFKEKIAKERLNLKKKDEKVVIIAQGPDVNEGDEEVTEEHINESEQKNIPNYMKWWNKFFKYNG